MHFFGKKIVSGLLVVTFITTPLLLPKHVEAQGKETIGMAGCIGNAVAAAGGLIAVGAAVFDFIAVPITNPPIEMNTNADATANISDIFIQCVLNAIVKIIKEAMIAEITASIVRWINSGFEGAPDFISNPGDFFGTMADRAAGGFIQEMGVGFLCEPFRVDLQIALTLQYYAERQQPTCTLSNVMTNIQNFYVGLAGIQNWQQWVAVTMDPANDPLAAMGLMSNRLSVRVGNEIQHWDFDLSANGGFLGVKTCVDERPNPGDPDSTICMKYETMTPGHSAQYALDRVTGTGLYQLEIADAIDEIIDALLAQLLSQIFTGLGGLRGTTDSNFGSGTYIDDIENNSITAGFTALRQQLINQITATLNQLTTALNNSSDPALSAQIQRAIEYLRDLLNQVLAATSIQELQRLQNLFFHPPEGIIYNPQPVGGGGDDVPPPPDDDPPVEP
jgi:hypothetical protein